MKCDKQQEHISLSKNGGKEHENRKYRGTDEVMFSHD